MFFGKMYLINNKIILASFNLFTQPPSGFSTADGVSDFPTTQQ